MNGVPIAHQGEDEQQKGDQEQPGSFLGIDCMPLMLLRRTVPTLSVNHERIVRCAHGRERCQPTGASGSGGVVLHYASLAIVYRCMIIAP
jgi:hypothetical protein